MEALYIQPLVEDGVIMEEGEWEKRGEEERGAMEASSLMDSTTDEETDEDSEPEPPPAAVCRKVSFADAFGLNLVSVKEFDNVEVTDAETSQSPLGEATHPLEEYYLTCLFTVPSTPEELDQRLQAQMIELESIELLPGTTTLRGIIRVVNLCYTKFVYARISLDHWNSYFDLLAEYLPGSSDRKTDSFTFKYTLVPPFGRKGTRVEFCLRYETSLSTFWANNKEMNYVMFCHQKGQMREYGPQVVEDSAGYKSKRSCLKANRRGSTEDRTKENTNTATVLAEADTIFKAEADRKTVDSSEIQPLLYSEEHKHLMDIIRNQHRATHLACVKDLSQRRQQVPKAYSPDSSSGQKMSHPLPASCGNSASFLYKRQKKHSNEVLTYHQIPLLTLDWNNDKRQQWGTADMDDIWTGGGKMTLEKASEENIEDRPPGNDVWETLLNGADDTTDKGMSVCDIWQAFLNGQSCKDHSGVPESEWLQTAASVSPSNDKEPQTRYASSSQEFQEFQVGMDTPTTSHAHTSAACQLLSDTHETSLANVALNTEDHQPEEGCGRSPRDDNTVTQDASQRSQTNSGTDTLQEFTLKGATSVSEGSVDSSTKCHKHAIWERERKGIIGEAEAIGGDEPFTPHIADLVTSSGESKTTDMTAMPESHNARTVDSISQGARLYSSKEGEVTGTAHNAMDDTLAFRETIRQGTKDGEGFFFSTSRQGAEDRIVTNCMENKVSTEEELFRPLKMEECEISQRYVDEKECEDFRLNQKSEHPFQENEGNENKIAPAQSHSDEFSPKQMCEENSVLKSETGEHVLVSNQTEEGKCLSSILGQQQEINSSSQTTHTVDSCDRINVFQSDHDRFRPLPTDKCIANPMEVVELRWTPSQEDVGSEVTPEDIMVKETVAHKDTSTELRHQPEILERAEVDMSQRDKDERVSVGKQKKIEAMAELMGNVNHPRDERKNALAQLKERELSAEVESYQPVEYKKLSEGTKDPITAENSVVLEEIESEVEKMLIERFVEDLVRGICEEVFGRKVQDCNRDTNIVDGAGGRLADISDITHDYHLLFDKDFSDAFDSGVFSLTELATDPNLSLCQGSQPTIVTKSNEYAPDENNQSLTTTDQFNFLSELRRDLNSSAHLSQDFTTTVATLSRPSLTKPAQTLSSSKDQEDCYQLKERSLTHQETGRQIEDYIAVQKESFNQSAHPSHKHLSSSPDKLRESDGLIWWSILYILSHITRLLICALLVAGFFVIVFLYDLPSFFALYIFSLCWWFYKWRGRQVTKNKETIE